MGKFKVYITKEIQEVWELEAENENDARISYDLIGTLVSEKTNYTDIEIDEE